MTVRPTLRCLREDLRLPLPTARVPLDEIDHPILRKAAEQFAAPDTPHERIVSIDDVVLFKVKTGRWRGAVFPEESGEDARDWLVAAGIREEGAPDDFYAALHAQARAARQRYNAEHDKPLTTDTCTEPLLPVPNDITAIILTRVPGCEPDAWFPEYALPERELLPAEQAWSNIMDPKAAAQLLDEQP